MVLNSAIGNYNGDIYEDYFKVVKQANPPTQTKAPYSAAIESMLNRPSKEERERFEKSAETAKILSKWIYASVPLQMLLAMLKYVG